MSAILGREMGGGAYIVGVVNGPLFCDDEGVEEKLLTAFQRLAKYPGVDENDLITLSVIEKEVAWMLNFPMEECF